METLMSRAFRVCKECGILYEVAHRYLGIEPHSVSTEEVITKHFSDYFISCPKCGTNEYIDEPAWRKYFNLGERDD